MSKEQELGLQKDRKQFDIREEYFVSAQLIAMAFLNPFMFPQRNSARLRRRTGSRSAFNDQKVSQSGAYHQRNLHRRSREPLPPLTLLPIPLLVPSSPPNSIIIL